MEIKNAFTEFLLKVCLLLCLFWFEKVLPSGDEDPDLSDALSTSLWELTLLAEHSNPEVAKYSSTVAGMNSTSSTVMPAMTPEAAVARFSSIFSNMALQSPSIVNLRKYARQKKQTWPSPFSTLEEATGLTIPRDMPTAEDIKRVEKVLGSQFRVFKACRSRPTRKRRA